MNRFLSQNALSEIRRNISRSLADTFQMMFHLDIFLLPCLQPLQDEQIIHSYMNITHQESYARLTISISSRLVKYICASLTPGITEHAAHITQDIVCEITNIVGNHLASYLAETHGLRIKLSLPFPGPSPVPSELAHALDLHFRIRENEHLDLDLSYTSPPQSVAV